MHIGFIGLAVMGKPMPNHLINAGGGDRGHSSLVQSLELAAKHKINSIF